MPGRRFKNQPLTVDSQIRHTFMTRLLSAARAIAIMGWLIGTLGCVAGIVRMEAEAAAPLRAAGFAAMGISLMAAIVACRPGWSWRDIVDGTPAWMQAGASGTVLLAGTGLLACLDPHGHSRGLLDGHAAVLGGRQTPAA